MPTPRSPSSPVAASWIYPCSADDNVPWHAHVSSPAPPTTWLPCCPQRATGTGRTWQTHARGHPGASRPAWRASMHCRPGMRSQWIGKAAKSSIHATSTSGNPRWWYPYYDARPAPWDDTIDPSGSQTASTVQCLEGKSFRFNIIPVSSDSPTHWCTRWSTWTAAGTVANARPVARRAAHQQPQSRWSDGHATSPWCGIRSPSV